MDNICRRCDSPNLKLRDDYELYDPETDNIELVSGLLCADCECFHELNGNFFQYDVIERSYKTQFIDYAKIGGAGVPRQM